MAGNWNSGRRPTPTALKLLRGNPGKRRLNPNEPVLPLLDASFDAPPPELATDRLAQAEWARVAPLLRACGLISEAERPAILALCQQWSRYLDASAQVQRLGMLVPGKDQVPMPNPYLEISDRALAHCHRLWAELGLTPSGRARVARLPPGRVDPAPSRWAGLL
jgi:P27 family predicted phage terminase small subunit